MASRLHRRLSSCVVVCSKNANSDRYSVLLVRRSSKYSFMPNAYVFPGGKVDPGDQTPEYHINNVNLHEKSKHEMFKICAAREI